MLLRCTNCKADKEHIEFSMHRGAYTNRLDRSAWCKNCHALKDKRKVRLSPKWRVANIRSCARNRNITFAMSTEEAMLFWQKPCTYCGGAIETIGLDRVDYTKGYTLDNVVSCCRICNVMKFTMAPDEFIRHCQQIIYHVGEFGLKTQLNEEKKSA